MELQIEQLPLNIDKVNLIGKMDLAGSERIDIKLNALAGISQKLIIDMEQVSFLASMGIRSLIMSAKVVQRNGGKILILKPNADVEQVLTSSGTDTLIPIFHDLEAAISTLSL